MTRAKWVQKDKKFSSGLQPVDGSLLVIYRLCVCPQGQCGLWRQLIFIWHLVFFHSSSSSREESNISLLKVLPFAQWIYEHKNKNVQHNFHLFAKKAPVALLLNLALWPRGLATGRGVLAALFISQGEEWLVAVMKRLCFWEVKWKYSGWSW